MGKLDELTVTLLTLAQGPLGLAVGGQVMPGNHKTERGARHIPDHPEGHLHRVPIIVLRVPRLKHGHRVLLGFLNNTLRAVPVEPGMEDLGDVPSRTRFGSAADHAVEFPVGAHQPALRVEQVDGVHRGVHRRAPFVGRLLQRGLRLLALGNILAGKKHAADRPVVVMQKGVVKRDHALLAAAGEDSVLEELHRLDLSRHLLGEDLLNNADYRGRKADVEPVAPQKLVFCPTEDLASLLVDQDNGAGAVYGGKHDAGDIQVKLRPVPLADRGIEHGLLVDLFRLLFPVRELYEPEEDRVDADCTYGHQKAGQQKKMVHPAEQVGSAALRELLQVAVGKQDEDKGHPEEGEKQVKESMAGPSSHGHSRYSCAVILAMIIVREA